VCAKRDAKAARLLDYQAMGSFERFKTKAHFNSLKQLVGVTALAALAVKLLTVGPGHRRRGRHPHRSFGRPSAGAGRELAADRVGCHPPAGRDHLPLARLGSMG
jgi:hypothetical protein